MNNYNNNQQTYQNHIDGIRAIAVVVVWLFHLNPFFREDISELIFFLLFQDM